MMCRDPCVCLGLGSVSSVYEWVSEWSGVIAQCVQTGGPDSRGAGTGPTDGRDRGHILYNTVCLTINGTGESTRGHVGFRTRCLIFRHCSRPSVPALVAVVPPPSYVYPALPGQGSGHIGLSPFLTTAAAMTTS